MLILVGAIGGSAVWFTIVQKWLIGAFCPYCMITHAIGLLLTVLVIWRASIHFKDYSMDDALMHRRGALDMEVAAPGASVKNVSPTTQWRVIGGLPVIGLVLSGIMVICQVVIKPPAVYRGGESHQSQPIIDPHTAPLVGSPDAPNVISLLFDYKCPHCQQLHFLLDGVIQRYQGKLAFALCPAPLSTQCNPYVPRNMDEYKDSCELAKVALAVWVAKREAFPAFNRWMFTLESGDRWRPRSLDATRAKAVELVGQAKFDAAQVNPWIDHYLQTSIRLYGGTIQSGNAVPKMIFGSRWVIPQPNDSEDLIVILQNTLAIPKP